MSGDDREQWKQSYLDAVVGSRMRIQERYVHASTGFLERAETLEHPV